MRSRSLLPELFKQQRLGQGIIGQFGRQFMNIGLRVALPIWPARLPPAGELAMRHEVKRIRLAQDEEGELVVGDSFDSPRPGCIGRMEMRAL